MVVNYTMWISELGNKLCTQENCDIGIVWTYDHRDSSMLVSLRSDSAEVDVSVIAKRRGGGGHPKAAAFKYKGDIEKLFT